MSRLVLFLPLIGMAATAIAQDGRGAANGKLVFDKWCAPCHGTAVTHDGLFGGGPLPGTAALQVKYGGALPAVLEERTDLAGEYVRAVVRGGLFGMPISRKTEISDRDLADVIAYLRRNSPGG